MNDKMPVLRENVHRVSDCAWNQDCYSLQAMLDVQEKQFVLQSAFKRGETTLNRKEARRLHTALSLFLEATK